MKAKMKKAFKRIMFPRRSKNVFKQYYGTINRKIKREDKREAEAAAF